MSRPNTSRETVLSTLGSRIKEERIRRGLTQEELSGEEITRNMLSRIENGEALPSLTTLCAIAEQMNLPVWSLLCDSDEYNKIQLVSELRTLIRKNLYEEAVEKIRESGILNVAVENTDDTIGLNELICTAEWHYADILYKCGKIQSSREFLECAKRFDGDGRYSNDIFALDCLLYMAENPLSAEIGQDSEKIHERLFQSEERMIYIYALSLTESASAEVHSIPHEKVAEYTAELEHLIAPLDSMSFVRCHIESKLLMLDANYLDAKAKLTAFLKVGTPIAPSLLFAVYSDLEMCCKCCGDFENAYKFSSEKLMLLQKYK